MLKFGGSGKRDLDDHVGPKSREYLSYKSIEFSVLTLVKYIYVLFCLGKG